MLKAVFWISVIATLYCYVGYVLILWLATAIKTKLNKTTTPPTFDELPEVTLLIAAYNESSCVQQKIRNSMELIYPKNKLHQVWITDGSTDDTNVQLAQHGYIRVLFEPERKGKTAALNRAIQYIDTQYVIFCDANTSLTPNTAIELIQPFANPKVGCVAGEKRIMSGKDATSTGEGVYWQYESLIKRLESETGSVLGAAGELFAIRTPLYKKIPDDTILDDFEISISIALAGNRVIYRDKACASELGSANFAEEMKRKVRIAAGGFQLLSRKPELLNPIKHPQIAFKFFSHKFLRWAVVPFCLILAPIANMAIVAQGGGTFYACTLVAIAALYAIAALGYLLRNRNIKPHLIYLPFYALMTNMAQIMGLYRFAAKKQDVRWEKAKRAEYNSTSPE